jgi:hypothetical protein
MQKVLTVLAGGALAVLLSAPPAFAAPPAGRSEEVRTQSARVERHDRHGDDGDDWDDDGGWARRRDHDGGCCRCHHGVLSWVLDYLL